MTQRTRSRGGFTSPGTYSEWKKNASCSTLFWNNSANFSTLLRTGSFEQMTDYVIADFYARRSRGEIFFNPMWKSSQVSLITDVGQGFQRRLATPITCTGVPYYSEYRYDGPQFARLVLAHLGYTSDSLLPTKTLISQSDVQGLVREVSTKLLANRGTVTSNLFESLAQANQTLGMLQGPFKSLHRLITKAEAVKVTLKSSAGLWLQYRYGWKPLVADIHSILSGLQKQVGNKRETSSQEGQLSTSEIETRVATGSTYVLTYQKQNFDVVKVRAVSLDEYAATLYSNIGLTGKDLATLPWELIPYSFVADWFANVGDYLRAIAPLPGVKQLGSSVSTHCDRSTIWSAVSTAPTGTDTMVRPCTGTLFSQYTSYSRVPVGSPSLVIKSDFKLDTAMRAADAVSLILQRSNRVFSKG